MVLCLIGFCLIGVRLEHNYSSPRLDFECSECSDLDAQKGRIWNIYGLNFYDNEMDLGTSLWWNRFILRNGHDVASHGPRTAHLREECELCVSSVPNVPNVLKE